MRNNLILLLYGILLGMFIGIYKYPNNTQKEEQKVIYYEIKTYTALEELNIKEDLIDILIYHDIKYPEIVYAQAVLETGYFTSNVCNTYNNLFGLYDSKNKDYYKFNHWTESVLAYKNKVQYKFKGEEYNYCEYYKFLKKLGYAEDPEYENKVRVIVDRHKELFE